MGNIKTLLERAAREEEILPENVNYYVTAKLSPESTGWLSNRIYVEKFNRGDYVIINERIRDGDIVNLDVVNENHAREEVLDRLYCEAREVAKGRAKLDGNEVLDLTGKVVIDPAEALLYKKRFSN